MTDNPARTSLSTNLRVDQICDRFEHAWQEALRQQRPELRPRVEDYLGGRSGDEAGSLLRELVALEVEFRRRSGEQALPEEYRERLGIDDQLGTGLFPEAAISAKVAHRPLPETIGRYTIGDLIGTGAFGAVYHAHDSALGRDVAAKVSLLDAAMVRPGGSDLMSEARVLAGLRHPHIVQIFDVVQLDDGRVVFLSEFIKGQNLAERLKQGRPDDRESVQIIATVASALHYAHTQNVVHRDVKPSNILLDVRGRAYLTDFGLALTEESYGQLGRQGGTVAYMSPEQARGEGHLVDGRSDIFSLGIVLYELLTGTRPFVGSVAPEVMDRIQTIEPRPLRMLDDTIPRELERICLKMLAKRARDRYAVAQDLVDDLQAFLAEHPASPSRVPASADSATIQIVPKGLRSFDANDADFFLELVPGPRDRFRMPESIRFWKTRIEDIEGRCAFRVGILYGPSGSGKSSLVKAGLLPRLAPHVRSIYVEATPDETEARLLHKLARAIPDLPHGLDLGQTFARLRRGYDSSSGGKMLIVLDQFEQWLHGNADLANAPLVNALRQGDGDHLQVLLLVRDDFWIPITRFMRELEVPIAEGVNAAAVDLFDPAHAWRVLTEFGRAYGRWTGSEPQPEQATFIKRAIEGLSTEGRATPVRLALFCEVVKHKSWTPATYREIGGAKRTGVTYLRESFTGRDAPVHCRVHERAAKKVLAALLPPVGTNIKVHMCSEAELRAAAGYTHRPEDFQELMRILDAELRVVTPVDAASVWEGGTTVGKPELKQYQLTHDYLISDLRAWLTSEQRGTLRGRAQLRLEEISDLWRSTTQGRYLPGLGDYAFCRLFTSANRWTPAQRDIMTAARNRHMMRLAVVLVCATALVWSLTRWRGRIEAEGIVRGFLNADLTQVERQYTDSALRLSNWTRPLLAEEYARARHDGGDALRPALMLVRLAPLDETQYREYLYERLLTASAAEVGVICRAVEPYKSEFVDGLWTELKQAGVDDGLRRLRIASALARFAPDDPRWMSHAPTLVRDLTTLPSASSLQEWMTNLLPVREPTLDTLVNLVIDPNASSIQRFRATDILATFASDRPTRLAEANRFCCDDDQFEVLFRILSAHGAAAIKSLDERWAETLELDHQRQDRVAGAINLSVALLRMGAGQRAWDLLNTQTDDLTQVNQLIHMIARRKCDPQLVAQRLHKAIQNDEPLLASRLALALGEFPSNERQFRGSLLPDVLRVYQDRQQPAELHAAFEWLLNRWQQHDRIEEILAQLAQPGEVAADVRWYVNSQQQTMVILQAEPFMMGSPGDEEGHDPDEKQRTVQIHRRFAIGSHPVTKRQFLKAFPEFTAELFDKVSPGDDCPVNSVTWFDAARYCNWLSQQEGIPEREWCFEPNSDGVFAAGMRMKPGYLSLSGYRLGTEAEWEFACRAGTTTARYYGDDPDLLDKYIWCEPNSSGRMWPVGTLKPNGFGLFDMLGNSWDWVLDRDLYETQKVLLQNDVEDHQLEIVELGDDQKPITRVRKGASFNSAVSSQRPANRAPRPASEINEINSFRLFRTLPSREESPRD